MLRWIEAEVALGARRFFLLDGQWYEIGEAYLETIRSQVERLINDTPSVDLPAWVLGDKERDDNGSVPDLRPGYVCFAGTTSGPRCIGATAWRSATC
ncbi:TIGR04141 family sporadically distributed protein [Streptomyces sp. 4R-3d]|uniref:TIGR04141 family sporadically distributed protein n=1 Tax=Streptomyces sp. 4R-3d TaxID=2559605 RepID=UPI001FFDF6E7|nr:TIGR04141 family sporadically distributed protein [Streptomyces sp. 4R-3d]